MGYLGKEKTFLAGESKITSAINVSSVSLASSVFSGIRLVSSTTTLEEQALITW